MENKKIIKQVFDEEFDAKKMRDNILYKEGKSVLNPIKIFFKYALSACLVILCLVVILNSNNQKLESNPNELSLDNNIININKLDNVSTMLIDANIKEISNGLFLPWFEIFNEIKIPNNLDKFGGYSIYTRKDQNSPYDILNCYVYNYFSNESNRKIRIAFSDTYEPIRDYYFGEKGKLSSINNVELTIYKYQNSYMTKFKYKDYNFDIETDNITEEELISLLESLIK